MSVTRRTLTPQWQWLEKFILLVDNDKKESDLTVSIARRVELLGVKGQVGVELRRINDKKECDNVMSIRRMSWTPCQ